MKTLLVTAPASYPVTTAEAKVHLNISVADDDTYIAGLITAATGNIESLTGRRLINQTWKYFLDDWPDEDHIVLPYGKVQSVTSITYYDEDGDSAVFSTDSYIADTDSDPGRIVLKPSESWPTVALYSSNPIVIQYVCGYGATSAAVPEELKLAIKILIAHLYENREPVVVSYIGRVASTALPYSIDALTANYRLFP